ncbi:MAG: hypothetical protein LBG58_05340 [Planctomycetaceae bacterium]|jgi:flagellar biosynthesis/type III secretory pathway protein FliH|nr:hypothetical protein [Planctomycetaceae bacterium]
MVMSTLEELYVKGKEEGLEKGEINRGTRDILTVLNTRFKKVPLSISRAVHSYKDPIALESLLVQAAACTTLDEFEQDIVHR